MPDQTPTESATRAAELSALQRRVQAAARAHTPSKIDLSRWIAEDTMEILAPALAEKDARIRALEEQLAAARKEVARESALVSEARHERDAAQKEARTARREAVELITGDRSDVLHWAARQLRKTPMPTALTGPAWYGAGWKDAIDHLEDALAGAPTDAQVEIAAQSAEIGRLQALADRRWAAWKSARRRARRHAGWWRLSEARKQVWVQRALKLEEQRAAVRSVIATWEHRTHHGDSGPMDLLADLQAALRDRSAATPCGCGHPGADHWGESASGRTECMTAGCACGGPDVPRGPRSPDTMAAATWPSRAARRLADDAHPTTERNGQ